VRQLQQTPDLLLAVQHASANSSKGGDAKLPVAGFRTYDAGAAGLTVPVTVSLRSIWILFGVGADGCAESFAATCKVLKDADEYTTDNQRISQAQGLAVVGIYNLKLGRPI
jgi:hypothetical protein